MFLKDVISIFTSYEKDFYTFIYFRNNDFTNISVKISKKYFGS